MSLGAEDGSMAAAVLALASEAMTPPMMAMPMVPELDRQRCMLTLLDHARVAWRKLGASSLSFNRTLWRYMAGGCCAYAFEGNRYVPEPRTVNVRALDSWDAIVYEYPTDFEELGLTAQ